MSVCPSNVERHQKNFFINHLGPETCKRCYLISLNPTGAAPLRIGFLLGDIEFRPDAPECSSRSCLTFFNSYITPISPWVVFSNSSTITGWSLLCFVAGILIESLRWLVTNCLGGSSLELDTFWRAAFTSFLITASEHGFELKSR